MKMKQQGRSGMATNRITAAMLVEKGACHEQVVRFRAEWPDGAAVTIRNARKAVALGLDLDWLANEMLTAPALEAYEKATAPAREACEKATAPAWEAYEKATVPALVRAFRLETKSLPKGRRIAGMA